MSERAQSVGAPRIERCTNHWCIEFFAEDRFYSLCYKTWEECQKRAQWAVDRWGDHWKRALEKAAKGEK